MPRSSVKLFLRALFFDERVTLYEQCVRGARRSPKFALELIREIGDRIEGRPTQHVAVEPKRTTIFMPAPPAGVRPAAAATAEPATPSDERVDLANGFVDLTRSIPLPREATVLPPTA